MSSSISVSRLTTLLASLLWLAWTVDACGQNAIYHDKSQVQGFSKPFRVCELSTSTSGIVESIDAVAGSMVTKGQIVLRMNQQVHSEKVRAAKIARDSLGELKHAEVDLGAKKSRLARIAELSARQHATPVELEQAEDDVALAESIVERAKDRVAQQSAEYDRLLAELRQFEVTAPFDGVIVDVKKEVGEYVGIGDTVVCTIADLNKLSVEFLLPRNLRKEFNVEQQVDIYFTVQNETVRGIIKYISPYPSGETNTYTMRAVIENDDGHLSAGERCQISIGSNPDAIAPLSNSALRSEGA